MGKTKTSTMLTPRMTYATYELDLPEYWHSKLSMENLNSCFLWDELRNAMWDAGARECQVDVFGITLFWRCKFEEQSAVCAAIEAFLEKNR